MTSKLYHWTKIENKESIEKSGLKRDKWCIYLCREPDGWHGEICYEIQLDRSFNLTQLNDWEVLCWDPIPPERLKVI